MQSNARSNRKERIGTVISDKMDKTITVKVERIMHHAVYDRSVRKATKLKAHDEANTAKIGDVVRIQETRPLSKTKRWRLVEIVKKAAGNAGTNASALNEVEKDPAEKQG